MWQELLSSDLGAPQPLIVRVESIPAGHCFADHARHWNQLVYAISGVLTVNIEGSCFVIPPEQAAWVPIGTRHRVGSLLGAESRSLWLDDKICLGIATNCVVFSVSPLLRALICSRVTFCTGRSSEDSACERAGRCRGRSGAESRANRTQTRKMSCDNRALEVEGGGPRPTMMSTMSTP